MPKPKRADIEPAKLEALESDAYAHAGSASHWLRWGWALYGLDRFEEAADVARRCREANPGNLEVEFLLGMALKRCGRAGEAGEAFADVASAAARLEDPVRASMLHRLAVGQVNLLRGGKWDLEPETWVRT